eukprot:scaffold451_cov208-Pinguiococcus_pyrenoidosus.AAC.8
MLRAGSKRNEVAVLLRCQRLRAAQAPPPVALTEEGACRATCEHDRKRWAGGRCRPCCGEACQAPWTLEPSPPRPAGVQPGRCDPCDDGTAPMPPAAPALPRPASPSPSAP